MKNNDPHSPEEGRENPGNGNNGPHREDSDVKENEGVARFAKDKRKRITRVEKNPRQSENPERPEGQRRSFNPNFTEDNKPRFRRDDVSQDDYFNSESYHNAHPNDNRYDREYNSRPSYQNRGNRYSDSNGQRDNRDNRGGSRYGSDRGPSQDRGGYNADRKPRYDSDQKPRYNNDRQQPGGYGTDRKPRYDNDRGTPREGGYNADRKPRYDSDQKPRYGNDRPQSGGYGGDRKPRYDNDRGTPREGGYNADRKPRYDNDRYGAGRDDRRQGPGGNRPYDKNGQNNRYGNQRNDRQGGRPGFSKGGPGNGRPQQRREPVYNSENYPKYPRKEPESSIRLNRFLSISGICSRREADELITAGLVTVNGVVVSELGSRVNPNDEVKYNDKIVKGESKVYIVMNKPKGYVTSLDDPHADKTVMDLLKNAVKERVYPVGRLDKNSMGVLLITNDGDMTTKLTHPTYEKKKIYQVSLDKPLTKADMDQIATGVELEDGLIFADAISYVNETKREIGIEIHSGRNRIIRRIFEHLGYQVQKLDRVYFAGLTKKNLKRGAWRFLTPREVSALHSGQYE